MAASPLSVDESMGSLTISRTRTPTPKYWEGNTDTEAWVIQHEFNAANKPPTDIAMPARSAMLTYDSSNFTIDAYVQATEHSHEDLDPDSQSFWKDQLVLLFQAVSYLFGNTGYMEALHVAASSFVSFANITHMAATMIKSSHDDGIFNLGNIVLRLSRCWTYVNS